MSATVHKWNKRQQIGEEMVKNNYCYFELATNAVAKPFYYSTTGLTAAEAANELNEQLDAISEGTVYVSIQPDAKKKIHAKDWFFKITNETPAISGYNPDYINEKIEAALFRQKVEMQQAHNEKIAELNQKLLEQSAEPNLFDKLGEFVYNMQQISSMTKRKQEPTAAIHGVNEDLQRIYVHIPQNDFDNILKIFADKLDDPKTRFAFLKKLNEVFGE